MKILLIGKNGQVGHELTRWLQRIDGMQMQVVALDRSQLDLANLAQVREVIGQIRPSVIVNAAAYTAVDLAEQESEMAMRINGEAVGVIAREARRCGAALVHYSTDHVFDGVKSSPYVETDATSPVNAYGRSKLAGEEAIRASGVAHLILRTSWVYGTRGKNFLLTIQRLAGERNELAIVADQVGAPTWSRTVAQQTAQVLTQLCRRSQGSVAEAPVIDIDTWQKFGGMYHLTAQGHTTWHGLASAIVRSGPRAHDVRVKPIASDDYAAPARRPRNARLSCQRFVQCFGALPTWNEALAACLQEA